MKGNSEQEYKKSEDSSCLSVERGGGDRREEEYQEADYEGL